jgi:hypothetical protein
LTRHTAISLALLAALLGYWMPWLALPAAALQLNAYELSEWVTFMPAVQLGEVPFNRLSFLIPAACLALLFALASAQTRNPKRRSVLAIWPDSIWGWALLAGAGLSVAAVFPYYPYILTAYKDPEFQIQFFVACAVVLGIALAFVAPEWLNGLAQIALAVIGIGFSVWALWSLSPLAAELMRAPWPVGWGWPLTLAGLGVVAVSAWRGLFTQRL